jgi:hypothetical protein
MIIFIATSALQVPLLASSLACPVSPAAVPDRPRFGVNYDGLTQAREAALPVRLERSRPAAVEKSPTWAFVGGSQLPRRPDWHDSSSRWSRHVLRCSSRLPHRVCPMPWGAEGPRSVLESLATPKGPRGVGSQRRLTPVRVSLASRAPNVNAQSQPSPLAAPTMGRRAGEKSMLRPLEMEPGAAQTGHALVTCQRPTQARTWARAQAQSSHRTSPPAPEA